MLKTLFAFLLSALAFAAFAATDVNKASQADLETVRGIGPAMSGRILSERQKAPFKDWADMVDRVKGVGARNAARLSEAGLTVNGSPWTGAPAAAAATDAAKKAPKAGKTAKSDA